MSALPSEDLLIRVAGSGVENLDVTISRERTVRDLKEIVEQRAGPAACYQRLLFRGKDLADDALTLVAAGLQPRTKLMLRLNEQYAAPREAAVVSSRMKLRPSLLSLQVPPREARRRPHRRGRARDRRAQGERARARRPPPRGRARVARPLAPLSTRPSRTRSRSLARTKLSPPQPRLPPTPRALAPLRSPRSSRSAAAAERPEALKGLDEMLTQTMCKLDALETNGDADLRAQRKKQIQRCEATSALLLVARTPRAP